MTFGQPLWFWAFALFPILLALFLWNEHKRGEVLKRLIAARLQDRLASTASAAKRRLRFLILLLGLAGVILSLAQPRWGYTWEERKGRGRDVLIAIDVSRSMLANDLAPSRLVRAKLAAEDLIGQLPGDRVGLIAFAGSAFLQAPLTADHSAVLNSLHELDTEVIPRGGTNIAEAIRTATEAFGKGESEHRALVIFTDGEELDADATKAADREKNTFRIYTVGVGSQEGTIIALPNAEGGTEYLKDPAGQIVKSRLDEARLRAIAEASGGFYLHLQSGLSEMQQLVRSGLSTMSDQENKANLSRQPIERYQWPLAAALFFLASSMLIGERRRTAIRGAAAAFGAITVLYPAPATARESGLEAYNRQDYKGALEAFSKQLEKKPDSHALQYNLGTAAYRLKNFDKAMEAFGKASLSPDPQLRAKSEYNLGNTLAQRGIQQQKPEAKLQELKNALQHYDEALKAKPNDPDTVANREYVANLIKDLEKKTPPPDQQQKQDQKKDQQKQDQQKDQDKSQDQKDQKQQQQSDSKDQKSDPQDPGQGQQQKPGSDQQQKPEQGKEQDQQPSAGEEPKKEEPQGGGKDSQEQQKEGQGGQKPDPQDAKQNGEESGQAGDQGEQQAQPEPAPEQPPRDLSGELKSNPAPGREEGASDEDEQASDAAVPGSQGKESDEQQQARSLLDSLKGEDARVRLWEGTRRGTPRTLRDW